jgi:hypothetical protein
MTGSLLVAGLLALSLLWACGDSGAGDGKSEFNAPTKNTRYIFNQQNPDSSMTTISAGVVGEKTIDGKPYLVAQIAEVGAANTNQIYLNFTDPLHVTFAGGRVDTYSSSLPFGTPEVPFIEGELDEVVDLNLEPPVGESVDISCSGTGTLVGVDATADFAGSYVLVEEDASVETAMGIIHGCRHFEGSGVVSSEQIPESMNNIEMSAELWYSDSKGVVAMIFHRPPYEDIVFGLASVEDLGEGDESHGNIQRMGVVGGTGTGSFELSTYDVNQDFDADKNVHAKMILELRFMDEEKAKTSEEPPVSVEFGTTWGIFPHMLVSSPVSFFHPEESGMGFTYWIAYVDEAAKNEPENGIAYRISVMANTTNNPVRVTSRILYTKYQP